MGDIQPPLFEDGQTNAQESSSQTGEETNPTPADRPGDYAEYEKWKASQKADSSDRTGSDRRSVDTGRPAAPTESVKQDLPPKQEEEDETPQSYVHLANGQVLLVDDEDLPTSAGHQNAHGYWQQGNKVHTIVGVYPKEITVKG